MFHYKACGLPNIYLENGYVIEEGPLGVEYGIENMHELHAEIAVTLTKKSTGLTANEFRYLRIQLDLSKKTLAALLDTEQAQVSEWETGTTQIPVMADYCLRGFYLDSIDEKLDGGLLRQIAELDRSIHESEIKLKLLKEQCSWALASNKLCA